jgi:hypothetical protein
MAIGNIFCLGGRGHVANLVNAEGGLKALLKSISIKLVASGFATYKNRPDGYVESQLLLSPIIKIN